MGAMTWRPSTRLPSDTSQATMVPSAPPGGGGGAHSTAQYGSVKVWWRSHTQQSGVLPYAAYNHVFAPTAIQDEPSQPLACIVKHSAVMARHNQVLLP